MDLLAGRWAAPGRPGPPARSRSRDVDISPGHRPAFDLHPRPPPSLGQPTLRGTEGAAGVRVCDRCGRLGPDSSRGRQTGPGPGLPPPARPPWLARRPRSLTVNAGGDPPPQPPPRREQQAGRDSEGSWPSHGGGRAGRPWADRRGGRSPATGRRGRLGAVVLLSAPARSRGGCGEGGKPNRPCLILLFNFFFFCITVTHFRLQSGGGGGAACFLLLFLLRRGESILLPGPRRGGLLRPEGGEGEPGLGEWEGGEKLGIEGGKVDASRSGGRRPAQSQVTSNGLAGRRGQGLEQPARCLSRRDFACLISVSNKLSWTPLVGGWTELWRQAVLPFPKARLLSHGREGPGLPQAPSGLFSNSCAAVEKSSPSANVHQSSAVEGLPASQHAKGAALNQCQHLH